MELGLLGIDHSKIAIQEMEPIFLNKDGKEQFRDAFKNASHIHELVILTTCNRVEFYFAADSLEEGIQWIISQLAIQKNIEKDLIRNLLISYDKERCIQHLFEVACGIQSMVFGENEILSQVKEAYDNAKKQGSTGTYLNKVFQSAIATGKRARSETLISRGAYSVSSIAIDAIRQTKLDYFADSILIIGMGVMGIRCVKKCDALGHPELYIANRTKEKAEAIEKDHSVTTIDYDKALEDLDNFDIIITATSTRDPIITAAMLTNKKQLLVDLGLPRNIDAEIATNENKTVINVEGLKEVATKNIKRKEEEINKVMAIINDEKDRLFHWYSYKEKCQAK